ncbi:MAG: hypothetical protein J7L55_00140 [Desulfurococcales archaeon]|nr:hypothetical protein [Desulfurococcales archaeon]
MKIPETLKGRVRRAEEIFRKEFIGAFMALNSATTAMFGKPFYHILIMNPESVMKLLREYTMDDEVAITLLLKSMLKGLVEDPDALQDAVEALRNDEYDKFKKLIGAD